MSRKLNSIWACVAEDIAQKEETWNTKKSDISVDVEKGGDATHVILNRYTCREAKQKLPADTVSAVPYPLSGVDYSQFPSEWYDTNYTPIPSRPIHVGFYLGHGPSQALLVGRRILYKGERKSEIEWRPFPLDGKTPSFDLAEWPCRFMSSVPEKTPNGSTPWPKEGPVFRSNYTMRLMEKEGWKKGQGLNYYALCRDNMAFSARAIEVIAFLQSRVARIEQHLDHPTKTPGMIRLAKEYLKSGLEARAYRLSLSMEEKNEGVATYCNAFMALPDDAQELILTKALANHKRRLPLEQLKTELGRLMQNLLNNQCQFISEHTIKALHKCTQECIDLIEGTTQLCHDNTT